jgi:hypothetical protein
MKARVDRQDASLRRVRQLRGYGALTVATVLIASALWAPVPAPGGTRASFAAGAIWLYGGLQLWLARRTPWAERYPSRYVDPNTLPLPDRVRHFRRQLALGLIVFPLLSAWVAYDLNRLKSPATASVDVWVPVGFVYARLGYWPAVLMVPSLAVTLAIIVAVKLKRIGRVERRAGHDGRDDGPSGTGLHSLPGDSPERRGAAASHR